MSSFQLKAEILNKPERADYLKIMMCDRYCMGSEIFSKDRTIDFGLNPGELNGSGSIDRVLSCCFMGDSLTGEL